MGKKRIIEKSQEELFAESEKLDKAFKKESADSETKKKSREGRLYIFSSYNNTMMTLTNSQGETLAWTSAGALGFKGARKATPFAASKVAELICQKANALGVSSVKVFIRGIGSGRESALRSLGGQDLEITAIEDVTPLPHNGCRPPRARRV